MLARFVEENGKLLAVIDPFAIPASQFNDYTGNLIAEAIKERSRRGLSTFGKMYTVHAFTAETCI